MTLYNVRHHDEGEFSEDTVQGVFCDLDDPGIVGVMLEEDRCDGTLEELICGDYRDWRISR